MAFINWGEAYILHIDEMDQQHKQLADIVNEIYLHVSNNDLDYVANNAIYRLVALVKHHFETEEEMMMQVNYPEIDEHKKVHRELVDQIVAIAGKIRVELLLNPIDVLAFLRAWLNDHLLEEDTRFAHYLVKSGLPYDVSDMMK